MLKINRNSVVFDKTSHHFRPLFAYYESIRYDLKDLVSAMPFLLLALIRLMIFFFLGASIH